MNSKLTYFMSLILLVTGSLWAQGIDPGTDNLTHSWTFNDGTANDYVGGAHGILMGGAEIWEGSLFTVYPDQWMEMPADQIAINTYSEVTIATWIYPVEGINTEYTMLAYFGNTVNNVGNDYYFLTPARGDDKSRAAISIGVVSSPWNGESGADGPEYDDGELHHMVSTLTDSVITLYIDGELQATTALKSTNTIAGISPVYAYLAKGGYNDDPTWMGEILDFSIYNKALSAEEVLFLYHHQDASGIEDQAALQPDACYLLENYPNPFNPVTTISYNLPQASKVTITVFDVQGREISKLENGMQSAGRHTVRFNAENLSSGVYICQMETQHQVLSRRMLLLK